MTEKIEYIACGHPLDGAWRWKSVGADGVFCAHEDCFRVYPVLVGAPPKKEPTSLHLWEVDHPYYCSDSNYYSRECFTFYDSWEEFADEMLEADKDYNYLVRWDWQEAEEDADEDELEDGEVLKLFFLAQRKGLFFVNHVAVTKEDEPAIREYLEGYAQYIGELWSPLMASRLPQDK